MEIDFQSKYRALFFDNKSPRKYNNPKSQIILPKIELNFGQKID